MADWPCSNCVSRKLYSDRSAFLQIREHALKRSPKPSIQHEAQVAARGGPSAPAEKLELASGAYPARTGQSPSSITARGVVREVDPVYGTEWQRLICRDHIDLFHSPRWMKAVSQAFGIQFRAAVLERSGKLVGGVCWSDLDDMFGPRRVTLPFSDYSDIIADSVEDRNVLMEFAMMPGTPWVLRSHQHDLAEVNGWNSSKRNFVHHVIDVRPDAGSLMRSLSSMARRNTRKAERTELEVVEATSKDELRAWVELHINLRRTKFRMLAQPFSFFESVWDEFVAPGDGFLLLARHNGQVIAGTVYLVSGNTCYYKFNASHMDSLSLYPNNALMWHGMMLTKERGLEAMDLGRTNAAQEGLKSFKASYGGVPAEMTEYRFTVPGYSEPSAYNESRKSINELTTLLTDPSVPDSILRQASELLYRHFG